eukprot:762091-Rhodomonas_salina.1
MTLHSQARTLTDETREQVSELSRRSGRRKGKQRQARPKHTLRPPNFNLEDVKTHAPRLKRSWKLFIESKSWRQLGVAVLEKLFEGLPEVRGGEKREE